MRSTGNVRGRVRIGRCSRVRARLIHFIHSSGPDSSLPPSCKARRSSRRPNAPDSEPRCAERARRPRARAGAAPPADVMLEEQQELANRGREPDEPEAFGSSRSSIDRNGLGPPRLGGGASSMAMLTCPACSSLKSRLVTLSAQVLVGLTGRAGPDAAADSTQPPRCAGFAGARRGTASRLTGRRSVRSIPRRPVKRWTARPARCQRRRATRSVGVAARRCFRR